MTNLFVLALSVLAYAAPERVSVSYSGHSFQVVQDEKKIELIEDYRTQSAALNSCAKARSEVLWLHIRRKLASVPSLEKINTKDGNAVEYSYNKKSGKVLAFGGTGKLLRGLNKDFSSIMLAAKMGCKK